MSLKNGFVRSMHVMPMRPMVSGASALGVSESALAPASAAEPPPVGAFEQDVSARVPRIRKTHTARRSMHVDIGAPCPLAKNEIEK
jgi:hypothetical protein